MPAPAPTRAPSEQLHDRSTSALRRARPARGSARRRSPLARAGGPTSRNASGARSARTTAADGDAWSYFTHDQARSRAYRWGEDGIAGISDDGQRLCFALALWNGNDPILKERLFGLTNSEGNHGEDVKEYYFYLDATPTHSYMRQLYKYPQAAFPYDDLVETNAARSRDDLEYELLDTGVFDEDRYFDVVVEYAKASPEDLLIRITATNRGPDAALAPRCCRRSGSGTPGRGAGALARIEAPRPRLRAAAERPGPGPVVEAWHPDSANWTLTADGAEDAPLHRERDQRRAHVRGAQRDALS